MDLKEEFLGATDITTRFYFINNTNVAKDSMVLATRYTNLKDVLLAFYDLKSKFSNKPFSLNETKKARIKIEKNHIVDTYIDRDLDRKFIIRFIDYYIG